MQKKLYLCTEFSISLFSIFNFVTTMLTPRIPESLVAEASALIASASRIAVFTHMSPDGDAMGSSLGFFHYLRSLDKQVRVVLPNAFPSFLDWMPGADECIRYDEQPDVVRAWLDTVDLAICTDFNEPKRIGVLGDWLVQLSCPKLLIDHHLARPELTLQDCVSIIDSSSPSASELVYRLIYQMGGKLPLKSAESFYTGMMTDTGNFSFNSTDPELYLIVSQLVEMGVQKDQIYNRVMNSYSADRMRLMGYCLYRKMRIFPEHHAALIALSRRELMQFNFQSGDAEGIVNLPLQIGDIYYSIFMREDKLSVLDAPSPDGSKTKIKISLRSQGDRPVNLFAHDIFSGGGHANASGGEFRGSLADAVTAFMRNYEHYFRQD